MMKSGTLFGNAVIGTYADKLLNTNRIRRMQTAASFADAAQVLFECGYDEQVITFYPERDDLIVASELRRTVNTFKKLCPDPNLLHCVLIRYDCHNVQVLYKSRFIKMYLEDALYPFGEFDTDKLTKAIQSKDYTALPLRLKHVLDALDGNPSPLPLEIELALEKFMFQEIADTYPKIPNKYLQKYFETEIDLLNIKTFAKCRNYGTPLPKQLITNRSSLLKEEDLKIIHSSPIEKIRSNFSIHHYGEIINTIDDLTALESAVNNYLFQLSQESKKDIFSLNLIFAWFIMKLEELKVVKIILIGKKLGFSNERIRVLSRGVYDKFE